MERWSVDRYREEVGQTSPAAPRRKNRQIERYLQTDIIARLRALDLAAMIIPIPNSFYIPTRTAAERELARRLVAQLKRLGFILPGAADFVMLWFGGCGCIELKRDASRDLFGKIPKGRPSTTQKTFASDCADIDVPYEICRDWPEVLAVVTRWNVPRRR